MKSSHASGWNYDFSNAKSIQNIKVLLNNWNKHYEGCEENHYKFILPRFFIEEKIKDNYLGITGNAITYMFRCIHGKPITIGVKYKDNQNSYDIDWNLLDKPNITEIEINKPIKLNKMIEICEILSEDFEFVRIDLYLSTNDSIYFSEYTFTPHSGLQFFNDEQEKYYGALWK